MVCLYCGRLNFCVCVCFCFVFCLFCFIIYAIFLYKNEKITQNSELYKCNKYLEKKIRNQKFF